jgi:hypothetical protein
MEALAKHWMGERRGSMWDGGEAGSASNDAIRELVRTIAI